MWDPNPSEVDWDTLEKEATAHSRGHWGLPGAYQVNIQKKKKGGVRFSCLEIQVILKENKMFHGDRDSPRDRLPRGTEVLFSLPFSPPISQRQKIRLWLCLQVATNLKQRKKKNEKEKGKKRRLPF